jgi:hypothetical protein
MWRLPQRPGRLAGPARAVRPGRLHPTAWRVIEQVARDLDGLAGLRAARAHARAAAWRAGAHADGLLAIDVDGTLLDAHSPKQGAAGTYKGGFGFYPLLAYLDRGDGAGEALAGILRPGNAGSNTAQDHIDVVDLALAQLPTSARTQPLLVRADTGGATHALAEHLRERGVRFSVSLPADERVRAAVLAVPADAWQPAVDAGGQPRPGADVAELHTLELAGWPEGTRAICRREDPHPGAQLTFTDVDGHRFQVFITDQPDPDVTMLELRHRHRARVEDRIRCGKAPGCATSPSTCSAATRSGWSWCWPLRTCAAGCRPCCWRATSRSPSPRPCATDCCRWPPASSATLVA